MPKPPQFQLLFLGGGPHSVCLSGQVEGPFKPKQGVLCRRTLGPHGPITSGRLNPCSDPMERGGGAHMSRVQQLDVGRKDKKRQISEVSFIDESRTEASGSSRWRKVALLWVLLFGETGQSRGETRPIRTGCRWRPHQGDDGRGYTDGLVQEMIVSAVFSFK